MEEEGRVKGEKEKVTVAMVEEEEEEEGEETDAAPTRQMAMPKVSCNSRLFRSESLILFHRWMFGPESRSPQLVRKLTRAAGKPVLAETFPRQRDKLSALVPQGLPFVYLSSDGPTSINDSWPMFSFRLRRISKYGGPTQPSQCWTSSTRRTTQSSW